MKQRAVFLDRDGVINKMYYNAAFGLVDSPANLGQFELLSGVGKAIAKLNEIGFLVFVVSNQPGIAKGKFTKELLDAMTEKMQNRISFEGGNIDKVYYCLHHPEALIDEYRLHCECRKPKTGLLLQAAKEWDVDLSLSYMIGDGVTDVEAGQRAGTKTFFVNKLKCYHCESFVENKVAPDYIVGDLREAITVIQSIEAGDNDFVRNFIWKCTGN